MQRLRESLSVRRSPLRTLWRLWPLWLTILLAACASREVLLPKSADAPAGTDFSGYWQLQNDAAEQQRRIDAAIRHTDGVDDRLLRRQPPDGSPGSSRRRGGLVHVFLEHGSRLKITQTDTGLFISFDRAVVEEYRFGENREVAVGPVVADRVSGWEGRDYVIETLDQNDMKLTERLALLAGGDRLQRTITLRGRKSEQRTIVQNFERIR